MEQISSNQTNSLSPILGEAILKLTSTPPEEIKNALIALLIQLSETAVLQVANRDPSWSDRRGAFTAQAEILMSFLIELGLHERMLQPLLDFAIAIKGTSSKDSRLLMTEDAANKLRLSKSWSAGTSLFDRAQKMAIIVTSKVLQRKNIARDRAHRLLAAKIKKVGQKGTDRSIATWEKQHDDAIISDRKRVQKNVQVARRIRDITIAQINALTTEKCSSDNIASLLKYVPPILELIQEESLFVEAAVNDAITDTHDWSVERVLESFDSHLNGLSAYYKTGARLLDGAGQTVPMVSAITQRQDELCREKLESICGRALVGPQVSGTDMTLTQPVPRAQRTA